MIFYTKRYGLQSLSRVPSIDDDDDDGNEASGIIDINFEEKTGSTWEKKRRLRLFLIQIKAI